MEFSVIWQLKCQSIFKVMLQFALPIGFRFHFAEI